MPGVGSKPADLDAAGRQLAVEYRRLDALVPYARNARTHSEAQVAEIAGSIREFGFTNPVLIAEDGTLIAGHGRVLAARKLGMETVPAIVLTGLSEKQRRALVISDNRIALNAGWDEDLLALELSDLQEAGFDLGLTGFDDDELQDLLYGNREEQDGLTEDDAIPDVPATPVTRRGDLWLLGEHRLLCGDSTDPADVTRLMNGERAALFATDPPYLVDYDGTNHPTKKKASKRTKKIANKDWSEDYIEQPHWDDSSQGPEFYEAFCRVAIDHAIQENVAWYFDGGPDVPGSGMFAEGGLGGVEVRRESALHLANAIRAYRNPLHAQWVARLLDGDIAEAKALAARMDAPPALITRDLSVAKQWLRQRRRGGRTVGLLASSGAVRLVGEGVPPSPRSNELNPIGHWFLKPFTDFRSAGALEMPMSEFGCQGLELDYACLCWGGDLIWNDQGWLPRMMRAPRWQIARDTEKQRFRLNGYRVLLTRARAGLVLFVPRGEADDPTRSPDEMDACADALIAAGCAELTQN